MPVLVNRQPSNNIVTKCRKDGVAHVHKEGIDG